MNKLAEIMRDHAHDMNMIATLLDAGTVSNDSAFKSAMQLQATTTSKLVDEMTSITSQPTLFPKESVRERSA